MKSHLLSSAFKGLALLFCFVCPLRADQSGNFIYTDNGADITITSCNPAVFGALNIPTTIVGKPVAKIGPAAFQNCTRLTSVVIPPTVNSIGDFAFKSCKSLTAAYFMGAAPLVGTGVFDSTEDAFAVYWFNEAPGFSTGPLGAYATANIKFSPGAPSTITDFKGTAASLNIPSSIFGNVTSIAAGAFLNKANLTSVTLPSTITSIGDNAFKGCSNLAGVYFNGNAPSLGTGVFQSTSGALMLCCFNSAAGFPFAAEWSGYPLARMATTTISGQAFIIHGYAPSGPLVIPPSINGLSVAGVSQYAFEGCPGLTSVTFPSTIAAISGFAFANCPNLRSAIFQGAAPTMQTSVFVSAAPGFKVYFFGNATGFTPGAWAGWRSARIYYEVSDRNAWITHYEGPGGEVFIPPTIRGYPVTGIADGAFSNRQLTGVTVPATVTSVGNAAFQNNPGLTSVAFLGNAPALGAGTFDLTSNSFSVCFFTPASGFSVPEWNGYPSNSFDYSSGSGTASILGYSGSRSSVTIPSLIHGWLVTEIGNAAFQNYSGLTNVVLPETLTRIGTGAFSETGLIKVSIPSGVTNLEDGAFQKNPALVAAFFMGNAPTTTGAGVFDGAAPGFASYYFNSATGFSGWASSPVARFDYGIDSDVLTIYGYSGSLSEVTFPDQINNIPVSRIGGSHFWYNSALSVVRLPAGLKVIDPTTFYYCSGLTAVALPDSLTSIGERAFYGCSALTSVTIPASVTDIGNEAFAFSTSLSAATFLGSAPMMTSSAFQGTASGFRVIFFQNAPGFTPGSWMGYASQNWNYTALSDHVIVTGYAGPGGVVTVPATIAGLPVGALGDSAFAGHSDLTRVLLPNSVSSIGIEAFKDCTALKELPITPGLTTIAQGTYQNCSGLTDLILPAGVTGIGDSAFFHCTGLRKITFPGTVSSLGWNAFASCPNLAAAYFTNGAAPAPNLWGLVFTNAAPEFTLFYVSGTPGWPPDYFNYWYGYHTVAMKASVVDSGVVFMGFSGAVLAADIPETINGLPVTAIGASAFSGQTYLQTLSIPETVTSIGSQAFQNCSSLSGIAIPSQLVEIQAFAFQNCVSLESITFPASLAVIMQGAFSGCSKLASATFSGNAPSLGSNAFSGNDRNFTVTSFNDAPGFSSYPWSQFLRAAFTYSTAGGAATITGYSGTANSVEIPSTINGFSVSGIADNAFRAKTSLTAVSIPESISSIGNSAFLGCIRLASVTLPASLTRLGNLAFAGCSSLSTAFFSGASPSPATVGFFDGTASDFKVVFFNDAPGFTLPSWRGYPTAQIRWFTSGNEATITGYTGSASWISLPAYIGGVPVSKIGDGAFANKISLTGVAIPPTVSALGNNAFHGCSNLQGAFFEGGAPLLGAGVFDDTADGFQCYFYNSASGFTVPAWSGYPCTDLDYVIANGQATITDSLVAGNVVSLPLAISGFPVTSIGIGAFAGSASLSAVHLPVLLARIEDGAFEGCPTLGHVAIPASVTHLGNAAFRHCASLSRAYFYQGSGSFSLGAVAFEGAASNFSALVFGSNGGQVQTALASASIPVASAGASNPVSTWLVSKGLPHNADLLNDGNGDGVNLLMAYALNLDPNRTLSRKVPAPEFDGSNFHYAFFAGRPEVTYRVETSTDLVTWTATGVTLSARDAAGFQSATIPASAPRTFVRLVVSH